jgi:membrane protein implicated in regulation of membrane protease activity
MEWVLGFAIIGLVGLRFWLDVSNLLEGTRYRNEHPVPTGASGLVGQVAMVREQRATSDDYWVQFGPEAWLARPAKAGESFVPGEAVTIVEVHGLTLLVARR